MSSRTIARRELGSLSREKTIVLALLIQLVIAGFSSFLVVGLTSLYDPGAVEGDGITVGISGDTQETLVETARESEGIEAERYDDFEAALAAFDDNEVDAVVTGTPQPGEEGGTRIQVRAIAPAEDLRTTLIVVSLRSYLSDVEAAERDARADDLEFSPLDVPAEEQGSSFFGFTYTILLPLLLFLPPFLSGSIAVDSVTEELERGTLELLRVAPVSLVEIIDGKAGAMLLLAPLQALLWIGLLQFNGFAVSNVIALVVFVAAITGVTVAIGVGLALLTGTRRQAQLLYSVLVLALFGVAVVAPEHPAATVALLAADSPTGTTFAHVGAAAVLAVGLYALVRRWVRGLDPSTL
jgi:ABC-2 type transport system permease protein